MPVHPETLDHVEQIEVRLEALEQRVTALECGHAQPAPAPQKFAQPPVKKSQPHVADDRAPIFGAFPVIGAALLGMAGAYLLRALSSAQVVPRGLVAAVATLYAAGWMLASERVRARRFAAAVYAATSLLILGPMLWEMSIRFQAMSGVAAALILAAFIGLLIMLRAGQPGHLGPGFASGGLAAIALALSIGTHRMAEFTALIIAIYAVVEWRERSGWVRATAITLSDLAAWTLVFLYRLPPAERADYPALPGWVVLCLAAAVFAISAGSLAISAIVRRRRIAVFEAIQAMAAFAILLCGMAWLLPPSGAIGPTAAIGALCLAFSAACGAAAYGPLRQAAGRNFHLFSFWAVALLAAAVWLLIPVQAASVLLALLGVALLLAGRYSRLNVLDWQGLTLLAVGSGASGLMLFGFAVLAGAMPPAPGLQIFLIAICLAGGYGVVQECAADGWARQVVPLLAVLLAAFAFLALVARGLVGAIGAAMTLDVFHIALLRTGVLCVTAVLLAWGGAHLRRHQMVRVAYIALAFVAAKLLFEDLRHGNLTFIAASLFLVALTMMAVPRLGKIQGPPRTTAE